jgi:hemerythrin-like domain-containing protein
MTADAIVILKEDHRTIRILFEQIRAAPAEAHATRARLVQDIVREITTHTRHGDEVMYARVRELVPDLDQQAAAPTREDDTAAALCAELSSMTPTDEQFPTLVGYLIESMDRHIDHEEAHRFPAVRAAVGRGPLTEIGDLILELRRAATERSR